MLSWDLENERKWCKDEHKRNDRDEINVMEIRTNEMARYEAVIV